MTVMAEATLVSVVTMVAIAEGADMVSVASVSTVVAVTMLGPFETGIDLNLSCD